MTLCLSLCHQPTIFLPQHFKQIVQSQSQLLFADFRRKSAETYHTLLCQIFDNDNMVSMTIYIIIMATDAFCNDFVQSLWSVLCIFFCTKNLLFELSRKCAHFLHWINQEFWNYNFDLLEFYGLKWDIKGLCIKWNHRRWFLKAMVGGFSYKNMTKYSKTLIKQG